MPWSCSVDMTEVRIAQLSEQQVEHPIISWDQRGFWRGWHHYMPWEVHNKTPHVIWSKDPDDYKIPETFKLELLRWRLLFHTRFYVWKTCIDLRKETIDNLPLLGLLGNWPPQKGQATESQEITETCLVCKCPEQSIHPPSKTHEAKPVKDQAHLLTKSPHRYHQSMIP